MFNRNMLFIFTSFLIISWTMASMNSTEDLALRTPNGYPPPQDMTSNTLLVDSSTPTPREVSGRRFSRRRFTKRHKHLTHRHHSRATRRHRHRNHRSWL